MAVGKTEQKRRHFRTIRGLRVIVSDVLEALRKGDIRDPDIAKAIFSGCRVQCDLIARGQLAERMTRIEEKLGLVEILPALGTSPITKLQ